VFAVPGNITSKMSWAPNLLIKQGAKLVQEWNDVVVDLPEPDRQALAQCKRQQLLALEPVVADAQNTKNKTLNDSADPQAALKNQTLAVLAFDKTVHLDHLMEMLEGRSASEVIAALFELELLGLVRQLPGKNFIKTWVD
jgi:DNA processing protein